MIFLYLRFEIRFFIDKLKPLHSKILSFSGCSYEEEGRGGGGEKFSGRFKNRGGTIKKRAKGEGGGGGGKPFLKH
jgi:flavodoxin